MQLYALDQEAFIEASRADKEKNYRCPECLGKVRVRGGPHRQTHFYHLQSSASCRQSGKSEAHLQTQLLLLSLLPEGEAKLERAFPEIGRIADVAWESAKIVFEIQCSPISLEEVQNRGRDYAKAGFQLVWFLHDKRFNKRSLSAAEDFLRKNVACYFTSSNGVFYDQFDVCQGGKRVFRGPPLNLTITKPLIIPFFSSPGLPKAVVERLHRWPLSLPGDLLDRARKYPLDGMLAMENRYSSPRHFRSHPSLWQRLSSIYKIIFTAFLEKLCR